MNHQYDKSNSFLQLVNSYVNTYINNNLQIISPLSSMWELDIMRIFCKEEKMRKFHSYFISCNEPVKLLPTHCSNRINVDLLKDDSLYDDTVTLIRSTIETSIPKIGVSCYNDQHMNKSNSDDHNIPALKSKQKDDENFWWCTKCEKCAFIYLLLSAWLPPDEVISIFGCNIFDNIDMMEIFLSLIGADDRMKPFEVCTYKTSCFN